MLLSAQMALERKFFGRPIRAHLALLDTPERFVQQALGHNSKAAHRAYAKHAEVTVPSLADWEKEWQENPQRSGQPKLLPVDFRSPLTVVAQSN